MTKLAASLYLFDRSMRRPTFVVVGCTRARSTHTPNHVRGIYPKIRQATNFQSNGPAVAEAARTATTRSQAGVARREAKKP